MDRFLNAQCINVLDKITEMPIFKAAYNHLESLGEIEDKFFPYKIIYSKLENNEFKTPLEFADYATKKFKEAAKRMDSNSEFGIILETISKTFLSKITLINNKYNVYEPKITEFKEKVNSIIETLPGYFF